MTEEEFQRHRDYFDWFIAKMQPPDVNRNRAAHHHALFRNIGLRLYFDSLLYTGCYLVFRPEFINSWIHLHNDQEEITSMETRIGTWMPFTASLIKEADIQRDLRQITVLTAMLVYPPVSTK